MAVVVIHPQALAGGEHGAAGGGGVHHAASAFAGIQYTQTSPHRRQWMV